MKTLEKYTLFLFRFLFFSITLIVLGCKNYERNKDKIVIFSIQNTSVREPKIQLEMNIDSSFMFFSPLYNDNISDSFTVIRFKTQNEKIKINLMESYFDLKLDTLLNLKKDTSYILIQFSYLPDTTRLKKFNKAGLEVDSIIVNNEVPSLSLKRMDYW